MNEELEELKAEVEDLLAKHEVQDELLALKLVNLILRKQRETMEETFDSCREVING